MAKKQKSVAKTAIELEFEEWASKDAAEHASEITNENLASAPVVTLVRYAVLVLVSGISALSSRLQELEANGDVATDSRACKTSTRASARVVALAGRGKK